MIKWQNLDLGDEAPNRCRVVIEVPRGSRVKLAVDHARGFLQLKDFLLSSVPFPAHYGFFPRTVGTDTDPLDVLVISNYDVPHLTVMEVRPVGAVDVRYPKKGIERKIIAVCPDDPVFGKAKDLHDIAEEKVEELRIFYETFETKDKRDLKVVKFVERTAAKKTIEAAMGRYGWGWAA